LFELTKNESISLIDKGVSQFVIPQGYNIGSSRIFAFTEQGVAMLSSVIRSKTAIEINIQIMRAFVELRRLVHGYDELSQKIKQLELDTNMQFNEIYQALTELASQKEKDQKPVNPVGYLSYD